MLNFLRKNMQQLKKFQTGRWRYNSGGGGGLEIFKIFSVSAAARLYLFLISGGGSEIFKIFSVSAAAAAAQPIGLHL